MAGHDRKCWPTLFLLAPASSITLIVKLRVTELQNEL